MPKFSALRMAGSEIIRTMGAMLLIILVGSQILDAGAVMTGGCRTFCGNITVDYPFGIEQGCGHPKYRDLVYCINNVMMFHVISGSYEVVNIDYGFKVLDIFDPKMSTCASMHKSDGFFLEEARSRYLQPTPDNAFMLLGCSKASPLFEGFPDKHLPCRNVTGMGCDAFYDCPSWVGFGKKSRATRPPPCCGIPYSSIGTCVLGACCCGSYRRAISSLEPCLNTRVISEESWELAMKPLYCGNIKYEARQTDIERLFGRYGRIDRVDMKSGYAFIYMEDERDAEDAIRGLDNTEFGRQRRRLTVEWTKHADRGLRRSEDGRRSVTGLKPTKTLFVINFDPYNTRVTDLENHFQPYGKVVNVRIRRNFAFVHFDSQEEATKAFDSTHMSKLLDRVITVEYAQREDGNRRGGRSSPIRGGGRYGRYGEDRGRDRSASPIYGRRAMRGSPDYGRAPSPIYSRRPERRSPDYGRAPSPIYARRSARRSTDYARDASPVYCRDASPIHVRERSRSPVRRPGPSII